MLKNLIITLGVNSYLEKKREKARKEREKKELKKNLILLACCISLFLTAMIFGPHTETTDSSTTVIIKRR
jgi:O-antigen/teichoic acid export membrane protein